MRCQVLALPKNGYFVNDKCDNVFNAACGIRCKPGYYLKGSSLRICQEGGSWSGRTTECISKYKGSRLIRGGGGDIATLFLNSFLVRHS